MVVVVACCFGFSCYAVIDMTPTPITAQFRPPKLPNFHAAKPSFNLLGFRTNRVQFAVRADSSKSYSADIVLDPQDNDLARLPWIGPVPGDIAEIEAYCRIFRAAEHLHIALMDNLCNPLTGECVVSYEFPPEDKPLIEDKIVSILGCIVSLLNKAREDVLSGRSSIMSSFRSDNLSLTGDMVPPLALFRKEMKSCSERLHAILENYLILGDDRSTKVWRKLQRLKNVCYDSGYARPDEYPSPFLLANWSPVILTISREETFPNNDEIAFWKGGQITEESLRWLIDNGFKTIVDLRAEIVKDDFLQEFLADASISGKIEVVHIPVEVGTAPSMKQVEKFASVVADSHRKRVYLQSKEGVWRTSAMVSRWRQYMTRSASQIVTKPAIPPDKLPNDTPLKNDIHLDHDIHGPSQSTGDVSSRVMSSSKESKNHSCNKDVQNVLGSSDNLHLGEVRHDENGSMKTFSATVNPLKAQSPPGNVFSRYEMSRFLRNKRISPAYLNDRKTKIEKEVTKQNDRIWMPRKENSGYDSVSRPRQSKRLSESFEVGISSSTLQDLATTEISRQSGATYVSGIPDNGYRDGGYNAVKMPSVLSSMTLSSDEGKSGKTETLERSQKNGTASMLPGNSNLDVVEGNMCASATGVVRVQSRKKAEMFLVRTDGYSCTREKVTESSLAFSHPSTQQQMLMWKSTPRTVLLLKKLGQELMEQAKEVASYLYNEEKMNVLVEPELHDIFARIPGFGFIQTFYTQDTSDLHERVDFVACLGGDGVILHASNLFRGAVPPVVSFNLGSLGFLTSHAFNDYREDLRQVIHGNTTADGVYITLRMRLRCEIFRNGKAVPGKIFDVLNEIVVDRGSNPYLSKIECYEHGRLITKVQGDGVIVATPTGSTAYSTSAGGSMVHPNVPCMLFTPICPHSLSFRPVILPDSARLELKIPEDARSNAWVSFDGKRRQQLSRGHSVKIHMSQHPLPTVNKSDQTGDWFHSLIRCLNWNERQEQKAL
ncbi:unnamed protein product [Rhodiola kirilowii]